MDTLYFFEKEFVKFQDLVEMLLIDEEDATNDVEDAVNDNMKNYYQGRLDYIRSLLNFIKNAKEQ